MKTPLRGEMLRGADFIIAVVNAGRSNPIPTILRGSGQANGTWAIPACTLQHGCEIHYTVKFCVNRHVQEGRFATGTLLPGQLSNVLKTEALPQTN